MVDTCFGLRKEKGQEEDVSSDESNKETEPSEDDNEDSDVYTDNEECENEWIFECIIEGNDKDLDEYLEGSENTNQVLPIAEKGQNKELFESLHQVNVPNSKGKTPLHIAAKYNRREITKKLIESNANIMIQDLKKFTPLLTAVRHDSLEVYNLLKNNMKEVEVENFLVETVTIGKENTKGDGVRRETALNPLQIAVKFDCHKVAKQLIDIHDDPTWINTMDEKGNNLAYLATKNNSSRVLKLLLEEVKKNYTDFAEPFVNGELHVTHEGDSKEIARTRFQKRKSCPEQVSEDQGSENSNSESGEMKPEGSGSSDKFEDIKSEGRSDKLESDDKDTPLLVAAEKGYLKCLDLLVEYKADLCRKCKGEKTALHLAAENGNTGIIEKLLKAAPKLTNWKDKDDRTALHDAINQAKVVELLIQCRANVNKKDIHGRTPVSYAAEKGQTESTLKLIEKGADINLADSTKMRPIHYAAKEGNSEVFKVLATNKKIKLDQSKWNCLELAIDNNHEETAFTIFQIEKHKWQDMLRSRSKCDDDDSDEYYDTPMRKLIRKMPNVAKEVFNHCTEIKKDKNKPFHVTFCYEFLNDNYHLGMWKIHRTENQATEQDVIESEEPRQKTEMTEAAKKDDETSERPAKSTETSFRKKGESDQRTLKAYTGNRTFIRDNHPLMIMAEFKRTELLDHPLVSALLKTKWMNIGLKLTILNIFLYAVFLVLLTGYVLDIRAPYQFENSSSYKECPHFTEAKHPHFASYAQYGIIIMAAIELLIEILEIVQIYSCKIWLYIMEIENVLEWISCCTAILFAFNTTGCNESGMSPQLQWTIGTISVFLAWINMLLIIRKLEWFGIYVLMLYRIIIEFMKFFLVFSFLIVAFAISFHCLFQNQENFSTFLISLMKTTSMMIGGPDFTTTFLDETVHYKPISYVLFFLFMVLMAVVVINLLVALAVSNIQEFQNEADAAKRKMQVNFALELERIATSRILLKYFVSKCLGIEKTEETFKPSEQWWLSKKNAESWKLTEPYIKAAMNAEKDNSLKFVGRLDTKIKTLESNLDTRMKDMEAKLGKILDIMESKPKETSNLEKTQVIYGRKTRINSG